VWSTRDAETLWNTPAEIGVDGGCEREAVVRRQGDGMDAPVPGSVRMYSTTWCGYCRRLKSQLTREGIGFTEVDIETDPDSAAYVMSVNGGNQTVPTVVFPDGTAATNPSLAQVKARIG